MQAILLILASIVIFKNMYDNNKRIKNENEFRRILQQKENEIKILETILENKLKNKN